MAKVEIKLNWDGVGELLKSKEMQTMLGKRAATIAGRVEGEHEVYVAPTRAVAEVSAVGTNNRLLKALR